MRSGALRKQRDQSEDRHREDSRRQRPAEFEPALGDRLVEEVADGRAERPGQDEGRPEQSDPTDARRELDDRQHCERPGAHSVAIPPIAEE